MTKNQQLEHDVARVLTALEPGPLGWSSERIYRLLFTVSPDARELTFDETCACFAWIDRIQAELRNRGYGPSGARP